ncbi:MAG: 30S ribosomal protein S12 methylthiotransferase RimO [Bacillota bacterium]
MSLHVGVVSLGCAKNLVDTELMLGKLRQAGFTITSREDEADILIVNTCGFINSAKEEAIDTILSLARYREKGSCRALLVAGCLAQRYGRELLAEMPEIDGLIGTGEVSRVVEAVRAVLEGERICLAGKPGYLPGPGEQRLRTTPPYLAYVKIAEGCENRCTYCAIPDLRGAYRSRPTEELADEVRLLSGEGVREVILVAQDTTRYGLDLYGKLSLAALLKCLGRIEGPDWYRILYCYPAGIDDDLISAIAEEEKVCKYIDLPLQHISDKILRLMNRRGTSRQIAGLIEKMRAGIPGLTLRTTFLVGFPGETEEDFKQVLDFMEEMRFERLGVFAYSREEGTPAAGLPGQVPEEIKQERLDRAMALQQRISCVNNLGLAGTQARVLVEGRQPGNGGLYYGRSGAEAPDIDGKIVFSARAGLSPGDLVTVRITGARQYDLTGELI